MQKRSNSKKKRPAEDTLKKKYYDTLDMMNAMRNRDAGHNKTSIHIKKTTVTHADGSDEEFADTLKRGDTDDPFALHVDSNVNQTVTMTNA